METGHQAIPPARPLLLRRGDAIPRGRNGSGTRSSQDPALLASVCSASAAEHKGRPREQLMASLPNDLFATPPAPARIGSGSSGNSSTLSPSLGGRRTRVLAEHPLGCSGGGGGARRRRITPRPRAGRRGGRRGGARGRGPFAPRTSLPASLHPRSRRQETGGHGCHSRRLTDRPRLGHRTPRPRGRGPKVSRRSRGANGGAESSRSTARAGGGGGRREPGRRRRS